MIAATAVSVQMFSMKAQRMARSSICDWSSMLLPLYIAASGDMSVTVIDLCGSVYADKTRHFVSFTFTDRPNLAIFAACVLFLATTVVYSL
jgi:hypothetical protein